MEADSYAEFELPGTSQCILEVLEIPDAKPTRVSAAFLYDRKGYDTFDALGFPRNQGYGTDTDDIVVRLEFVIPYWDERHGNLSRLHEKEAEARHELDLANKAQAIEHAKRVLEAAQAAYDKALK